MPPGRGRARASVWLWAWLVLAALLGPRPGHAESVELAVFNVVRGEEGLLLNFSVNFELARSVEEALNRGVALNFEAEAEVLQTRWYWRDRRVMRTTRTWRLTYQPLTRMYRVGTGGLNQNYETLAEALDSLRRTARWKIAELGQFDDDGRYYLEFRFRLDTSLLPSPMQIGIGGEAAWSLSVERVQRLN